MTFDLNRFLEAQAGCYKRVVRELQAGEKRSHWMWFIFPQIAGLGFSEMSRLYAIKSLDEARAYAGHRILGARLIECTQLVHSMENKTVHEIFGSPDDLKFHSCMTLFRRASDDPAPFDGAIGKYFDGIDDTQTLALLGIASG